MARADYTYQLKEHSGRNILAIGDLDLGNTSLTNDIENVVAEIEKKERIDARDYMIVYRDSQYIWDGWDHRKRDFVALNQSTWPQAVDKYIQLQLKSVS